MVGWDELLEYLAETPRENGTAALHQTATFLRDALEGAGLEVELVPFSAHPYALRLAGVLALVGGLLYLRLMREGRHAAALATAVLVPALLLGELDYQLPVFGWIGAQIQHHLVSRLSVGDPSQRLLFTAHYDTKTDALDHVEREAVDFLALPVIPIMILGALAAGLASRVPRRERLLRRVGAASAVVAGVYGVAAFVALSAGVFAPARSPGALDDGGSCAVLVRLATALAEAPPLEQTEVEVALLSAEEVGVQGSRVYAEKRFSTAPDIPTFVVNLEGIGASDEHAVLGSERFILRSFPPDRRLVQLLDAVHRDRFAGPIAIAGDGGATDARSFLARGIPAVTLVTSEGGRLIPRGLHSARDDRSRLDEKALESSLSYLLAVVRAADARGISGASPVLP